jgi:hypothetical protein
MAWENAEIVIADATMKCSINRSDDKTRVQIPFIKGISVGDNISVNGKKMTINDFINIGGRNETLTLEILNDKSVQRGTESKSGKKSI